MAKYSNISVTNCEAGFVLPTSSTSTFDGIKIQDCRVGFLEHGSNEEFEILLKELFNNKEKFALLKSELESEHLTKKQKEEKIKTSPLFSSLAVFADVVTVYSFLAPFLINIAG